MVFMVHTPRFIQSARPVLVYWCFIRQDYHTGQIDWLYYRSLCDWSMSHEATLNVRIAHHNSRKQVKFSINAGFSAVPFPSCRYLTSLRGHVAAVYQVAWSADSRLLVSGSSDSTLKVWDVKTGKLSVDLPGHADEVRGSLRGFFVHIWFITFNIIHVY